MNYSKIKKFLEPIVKLKKLVCKGDDPCKVWNEYILLFWSRNVLYIFLKISNVLVLSLIVLKI